MSLGGRGVVAVTGGGDPTSIGPGLAGFLAIFAITLATWVLFRSMNKHLRTVRHSPDPAAGGTRGTGPAREADAPRDRTATGDETRAGDATGPHQSGDPGPGDEPGPFREEPPHGQQR